VEIMGNPIGNLTEYELHHLAEHLEFSGRAGDLYRLLSLETSDRRNAWYESKEIIGDTDGYLADLGRARRLAEIEGISTLGQVVRVTLCSASIISLSANIDKDMLVACFKFSPRLGLTMARAKPEVGERAECLAEVSRFLAPVEQYIVLSEALSIVRVIQEEGDRVHALRTVVEQIPLEATALLSESLTVARAIQDESYRVLALRSVVERIPTEATDLLAKALATAPAIHDADTLIAVTERIPTDATDLLAKALTAAYSIWNREARFKALHYVTGRILPQSTDLLIQAIAATCAIQDEWDRALTLRYVVERISPAATNLLAQALTVACDIHNEHDRVEALNAVIERIPQEATDLLNEVLNAAHAIQNKQHRADLLSAVAVRLPSKEQYVLLIKSLALARALQKDWMRANALTAVAARLPSKEQHIVLVEALDIIHAMKNVSEGDRILHLQALVKRIPTGANDLLAKALDIAGDLQNTYYSSDALCAIAERISPEATHLLSRTLAVARANQNARLLRAVAKRIPSVTTGLLVEALSAARAIQDAEVLSILARKFPLKQQLSVWTEALAAANAAPDDWEQRANALCLIAEQLPKEATDLLAEALIAARDIPNKGTRAKTIRTMIGRFSPKITELLTEILITWFPSEEQRTVLIKELIAASVIQDESDCANALWIIAERLQSEERRVMLWEALAAISVIHDESNRADALRAISEYLQSEEQHTVLAEDLAAARIIQDGSSRAKALSAIADQFPPKEQQTVLWESLAAIRDIQDKNSRAEVLCDVAARIPREATDLLAEALAEARTSQNIDALCKVAERLPLDEQRAVLGEVLAAVCAIQPEGSRVRPLCSVIKQISSESTDLLAKALVAACAIQHDEFRATVLHAVTERIPQGSTDLLANALAAARTIQSKNYRANALSILAGRLPTEEQRVVLDEALTIVNTIPDEWGHRANALRVVVEQIPSQATDLLTEALTVGRAIQDVWYRPDVLSAVAGRLLPEEQGTVLAEALALARTIQDTSWRVYALCAVARQLPPQEQHVVLAEALAIACAFWDWDSLDEKVDVEASRVCALRSVIELISPEFTDLLTKALAAVYGIEDKEERAKTLRDVIARIPPENTDLLAEALAANGAEYEVILSYLAPQWPKICRARGHTEFGEFLTALRAFVNAKRSNLLGAIQALLPVIARLGDKRVLREIAQAITDTARWWP